MIRGGRTSSAIIFARRRRSDKGIAMDRTVRLKSLVSLLLVLTAWANPAAAGPADKRLDVYWIDVEGGAATLVVTPAGESLLIDAGFPALRDASRIYRVATQQAGLSRIDHHLTTHYHLDHFGGAPTLATLLPIGSLYNNGDFKEGWEKPSREYAELKAEKKVVLNPGDDIPLGAGQQSPKLQVRCLPARQNTVTAPPGATPNDDCEDAPRQRPDYTDNANSI